MAIARFAPGAEAEFAVNSALNELWALGRRGLALAIDASNAAQVRHAIARAERELGWLDLAAVVALDEGAALALDALRAALAGRPAVVLPSDTARADALHEVTKHL